MTNEAVPDAGNPTAFTRRLATILAADVAGYSRMMGENEEATVQTLRAHRAVFEALLAQHHGRVFNTAGDAILAEFPSAVEAVRCATEIQAALQTRNEHLPAERKMLFRMGINLGDVVVQGGDLLGDGVNVAARIQTLAEPGGICISGSVYDQILNKLTLQIKPLGPQMLKNIGQPVRTFTITHGESGALPASARGSKRRWLRAAGVAAFVAAVVAAGSSWIYRDYQAKQLAQDNLVAQLAAAKQAAEAARIAVEAQNRRVAEAEERAERERTAAETAKREASLQSQAQSMEEARRRVDAERKQLDAEKQKLAAAESLANAAALKAQTAPADKSERGTRARNKLNDERQQSAAEKRGTVVAAANPRGSTAVPNAGSMAGPAANPFDGNYNGELCNFPNDADRRVCWPVTIAVQNGAAAGSWTRQPRGKTAYVHATITPEGLVKATLDGTNQNKDGAPMTAALAGHAVSNRIDVNGRWSNGLKVDGHWTRSP